MSLKTWRVLVGPDVTNREIATALGLAEGSARKVINGLARAGRDRENAELLLKGINLQPVSAKEYLRGIADGLDPGKLAEIEAKARSESLPGNKKAPNQSEPAAKQTLEEPKPFELISTNFKSSLAGPVPESAPIKMPQPVTVAASETSDSLKLNGASSVELDPKSVRFLYEQDAAFPLPEEHVVSPKVLEEQEKFQSLAGVPRYTVAKELSDLPDPNVARFAYLDEVADSSPAVEASLRRLLRPSQPKDPIEALLAMNYADDPDLFEAKLRATPFVGEYLEGPELNSGGLLAVARKLKQELPRKGLAKRLLGVFLGNTRPKVWSALDAYRRRVELRLETLQRTIAEDRRHLNLRARRPSDWRNNQTNEDILRHEQELEVLREFLGLVNDG